MAVGGGKAFSSYSLQTYPPQKNTCAEKPVHSGKSHRGASEELLREAQLAQAEICCIANISQNLLVSRSWLLRPREAWKPNIPDQITGHLGLWQRGTAKGPAEIVEEGHGVKGSRLGLV